MINLGKHFEKTEVTKEQLQAINELLGIKESKVWEPKDGQLYYGLDSTGDISEFYWNQTLLGNRRFNLGRFNLGNVFKTKEDAEFARDKQIFLTKMKRDFIENSDEIDWEDENQTKYYLTYYYSNQSIDLSNSKMCKRLGFYTTDREWLEQYAKDNEEDIKKYYFEVKEKEND